MLWVGLALLLGLLIGRVEPFLTLTLMVVVALAITILITPIAALTVTLVLAPLRTLIATESPLQLPLDIGQIALVGFLGAWVLYRITHQRALMPLRPPTLLLVGLIGWLVATGLSAFTAVSLGAWLNEWLKWVQVLVLILICLDFAAQGRWQLLVFALTCAGLANALIGIYIFFGGSGADHLIINGRFFRAFGTFGQPNPFGGFMGLLIPVTLMAAWGYGIRLRDQLRRRSLQFTHFALTTFYLFAAMLMAVALIMSWSRGAWLGLFASLAALIFALPRRLWQGVALLAVIALIIGGLYAAGRLPMTLVERIGSAFSETFNVTDVRGVDINSDNYALVERLAHWQAAINMATANPWLGVGFGNYEIAYEDYRLINWKFPLGHAHNYYLNVLGEAGMMGLIAYFTLLLCILIVTWQARRHPDPLARALLVGLFGSWVYLGLHSLTDNLYVNNMFLHLGVLLGLLAILSAQLRSRQLLRTS